MSQSSESAVVTSGFPSSAGMRAAVANWPRSSPARVVGLARRPRSGAARCRPTSTARSERYQVIVRWDSGADRGVRATSRRSGPTAIAPPTTRSTTPAAAKYLLSLIDSSATVGPRSAVRFSKEPDVTLPLDAAPRVSGAEQSNTSVVFEEEAIFKVFRRITPGINPDIELNRVLARAGNPHVARLLGLLRDVVGRRMANRARSAW